MEKYNNYSYANFYTLFYCLFYKILNLWSVLSSCREEILAVATDAEATEISGTELLSKEEEAAIGKNAQKSLASHKVVSLSHHAVLYVRHGIFTSSRGVIT